MEYRLNSLIYPIHGFIRSEFDDIENLLKGEYRRGQKVAVGKSEWRLEVQKECSEKTEDMDRLGVFLTCCPATDLLSSIDVFNSFQLISWNEEKKNHVWNDSSVTEYTDEDRSWGTSKFLEWEELMNGGFVKDGKIVVECAFRIESEYGIPRRSIDFTEERPNSKDIELICGVEDVLKSKRIEEIVDVSRIDEDGIFTETFFINGLPFKIELSKTKNEEDIDTLSVLLYLNSDDQSEWWRCEADVDISILNQNGESEFKTDNSDWLFQNSSNNIEFDELIKEESGYVKDGKIVIQATLQINRQFGFDKKTGQGYVQTMKKMTDACLKIGDEEFHVSKKILSQQSSYFSELFSRDEGSNEYEMTEDEIESVLELAEKYGAPEVIERFDAVLKRMELTDTMKMLELVDKYNLPELRRSFILKVKDEETLKSVVNNPRYKTLNDSLKVAILEWKLVPEKLKTEEKEETDYQFNTNFKRASEFTDVVITVEGYKYHASKQILANASVFFMKRFYGLHPSDETEIKILKVSPLQFETLLTHIYHPTRPVTCASLDSLLSLSKQFSVHRLMDKCEEYLILNNTLPLIRKLEYAGKYELPFLLSACLNLIEKEKSAQVILKHPNVGALSPFVYSALHKGRITKL